MALLCVGDLHFFIVLKGEVKLFFYPRHFYFSKGLKREVPIFFLTGTFGFLFGAVLFPFEEL